jgi:hypothetical protein
MAHQNNLINSGFEANTPSDTAFVDYVGLLIGGSGVVNVVDGLGVTTAITCVAGQCIPGKIVQVKSTSTTATNIVGLKA